LRQTRLHRLGDKQLARRDVLENIVDEGEVLLSDGPEGPKKKGGSG